jgi:H/ACA ribonucleoprotein complex subunit 3
MKDKCPKCNLKTISPKPPKYSPEDKYAKYRRIASTEKRKEAELI